MQRTLSIESGARSGPGRKGNVASVGKRIGRERRMFKFSPVGRSVQGGISFGPRRVPLIAFSGRLANKEATVGRLFVETGQPAERFTLDLHSPTAKLGERLPVSREGCNRPGEASSCLSLSLCISYSLASFCIFFLFSFALSLPLILCSIPSSAHFCSF